MNPATTIPAMSEAAMAPYFKIRKAALPPVPRNTARAIRPIENRTEIFFELDAGSAREVLLVGDFTNWDKMPIKLHKGENGGWYALVLLAPGQYYYKFIVDGKWQEDPCAPARSANPFGTADSILEIP